MPITDENTKDFKTGDNPYPILMESLTNELIVEVNYFYLFRLGLVRIIL